MSPRKKEVVASDPEVQAISGVIQALSPLSFSEQVRVLSYISQRWNGWMVEPTCQPTCQQATAEDSAPDEATAR